MQAAPVFQSPVHGLIQDLVVGKGVVANGLADANDILIHHSAGPEVQVPHLGVAHLPLWQAHRLTAADQLGPGIIG